MSKHKPVQFWQLTFQLLLYECVYVNDRSRFSDSIYLFIFFWVFWLMSNQCWQVDDLAEASKSILTLQSVIDRDIEGNCVRKAGSHTRNLLRVKRGLDMVRVLFEQILAAEYVYQHVIVSLIFLF